MLAVGVAAPLVVVRALGVAGTFLHGVPYVGVAAGFVVGGSVVSVRMTTAVENTGADIDVAETLDVFSERSAAPDAEATYSRFDGKPLRLSIYRPRATDAPAPILVFIHGGGFVAGDRDAHATDLRWFADRGWLVMSVDYALSSPDRHLRDVVQPQLGCALAWVTADAHRYGGDRARLPRRCRPRDREHLPRDGRRVHGWLAG